MSAVEDNDLGFDAILAQMKALADMQVTVGIHGDAPDGLAYIASLHEFGSQPWVVTKKQAYYMARFLMKIDPAAEPGRFWGTVHKLTGKTMRIPERSFLRHTFDTEQAKFNTALERVWDAVLTGDKQAMPAMQEFAAFAQVMFQRGLTEVKPPPNAPLTIAVKGSSNPLVDKGRLRAAILAHVSRRTGT